MDPKQEIIAELLKEYDTYTKLRDKTALLLEAMGVDVDARAQAALDAFFSPANKTRIPVGKTTTN